MYQYAGRKCDIFIMLSPRNSSGTNIPQRKAIPSEIVFAIMFIIASFVVSLLIKNANDRLTSI